MQYLLYLKISTNIKVAIQIVILKNDTEKWTLSWKYLWRSLKSSQQPYAQIRRNQLWFFAGWLLFVFRKTNRAWYKEWGVKRRFNNFIDIADYRFPDVFAITEEHHINHKCVFNNVFVIYSFRYDSFCTFVCTFYVIFKSV
jgi:hypothetical protein